MTSSFQGGSFNPVQNADYTPALQQSYEQINRGFETYQQQVRDNHNAHIRNSTKGWETLGHFSRLAKQWVDQHNEKKRVRHLAEGVEWYYQNGFPAEQAKAFDDAEAEEYSKAGDLNQIAANNDANGGDIWTSERFRNLSAAKKLGAIQAFVQHQASLYNPNSVEHIANATDPAERNAGVTAYRTQFFERFGDINPAILNKYVYPQLRATEKASYKTWYADRKSQLRADRLDAAHTELQQVFNGGNLGDGWQQYTQKTIGDYSNNYGKVRNEFTKITVKATRQGAVDSNQIDELKEYIFMGRDGSEKKFGDLYPDIIRDLREARYTYENDEAIKSRRAETIAIDTFHKNIYEEIKNIPPEKVDADWLELQQKKFHDISGGVDSQILQKIYSNYSSESLQFEADDARLAALQEMQLLSVTDLENVGGKLRSKYLNQAQQNDRARQTNVRNIDDVRNLSLVEVGGMLNKENDASVGRLGEIMVSRYLHLSRELAVAGVEDYQNEAYEQINTWWNAHKDNIKKFNGFDLSYLEKEGNSIAPLADKYRQEIARFNRGYEELGVAALDNQRYTTDDTGKKISTGETAFFNTKEVQSWEKGFGTFGWKVPEKVLHLARLYKTHPISIINRQRKALGMEELPDDRSGLKEFNRLNKENQRLLLTPGSDNPTTKARIWSTLPGGGIELLEVAEGLEEDLEIGSNESGLSKQTIAAAMYWNKINPSGVVDAYTESLYNALNYMTDPSRENLNKTVFPGFVYPQ